MALVLGTYAMAWGRSEADHASIIGAASKERSVDGLEVPWTGSFGNADLAVVLSTERPDWRIVVTSLPGTLAALSADPTFGLASSDRDGRQAAVAEVSRMRSAVASLNDSLGRPAVSAIELHSSPMPQDDACARDALARSLDTIVEWDWPDTQVLLEHVDAAVASHQPAKGFMSLEDEVDVIREHSLPIGILINWGRSAIELRDAARVVDHLGMARQAGVLKGLIFSGASAVATDYGEAWEDQHLPPRPHEPNSLLTAPLIDDALREAGLLEYTGVKMSWRGSSLQEGTAMLLDTARQIAAITDRHRQMTS